MQCKLCNVYEHFEIVHESSNFYLVFDNYGLHFGHLLLVPKEHILNFSQSKNEFIVLISDIITILNDFFETDIILYEHGNITENRTKNVSVDHAHFHLLPLNVGFDNIIQLMSSNLNVYETTLEVFYSNTQIKPYHFLSINGKNSVYTYDLWKSQGFREMYAYFEKYEKWDWKIDGEEIKALHSAMYVNKQRLKKYLSRRLNNVGD